MPNAAPAKKGYRKWDSATQAPWWRTSGSRERWRSSLESLTSPRDGDRGPCTVYKLEPVTWGRIPPCGSMRRRSGWDYPFQESHERREANVSPISRP